MTPKTLVMLGGAAVIVILGAAASVVAEQVSNTIPKPPNEPFFADLVAKPDDAQQIEIKSNDLDLALTKKGANWVMSNRGDYPVRTASVSQIVAALVSMKPYEAKTSNPDRYKEVAVEDPASKDAKSTLVTVKAADGKQVVNAIVGARSNSIGADPLGGQFVRRPNETQTWLVEGVVNLPASFNDWFDTIVHVPGPDVEHISILEGDKVVFHADKQMDDARTFKLATLDPKYAPTDAAAPAPTANDSAVKRLDLGIVSTTFDDVRPADQVKFPPDARTVRFQTNDGMVLDVTLGDADGKTWAKYTATAPDGSKGVQRAKDITDKTKGFAFALPVYRVQALQVQVADLLQKPQPPAPAGAPGASIPGLPPGVSLPPGFTLPGGAAPGAQLPGPRIGNVPPLINPQNP